MSGKLSAIGCLTGFLLLACAGILAFTADSPAALTNQLRGRKLYGATQTGLSGTPSSTSDASFNGDSSFVQSSASFDHVIFGGNHKMTLAPLGFVGGDYVAYIVLGIICSFYAWFYQMHVVNQIAPMPVQQETDKDDFDVGLCACWADLCMCSHLILPCMVYVRQAHTNEVTEVCGFWESFLAYLVTGLCCGIGPCCLTVFFRMRLKEHMGIQDHIINDLCLAWLCLPCAVGQHAMAVDQKLGYEVDGCCTLEWHDQNEKHRIKNPYEYDAEEDDSHYEDVFYDN